jgi:hypothetical protein
MDVVKDIRRSVARLIAFGAGKPFNSPGWALDQPHRSDHRRVGGILDVLKHLMESRTTALMPSTRATSYYLGQSTSL